jgi:predicted GNAT family N-acyltransferase
VDSEAAQALGSRIKYPRHFVQRLFAVCIRVGKLLIEISIVSFSNQQQDILAIRHRVFTVEQQVDPNIDFDGLDGLALQVLASSDGIAVGTGRMLTDGHIGRIAVLKEYRGKGIGSDIIQALVNQAREAGMAKVFLGSQVRAVPFYEKLGFSAAGDNYIEANILHTPMEMTIEDA